MKKTAICIALLGLVALGGQAIAAIGTIDDVPAATLLLPYFEVSPDGNLTTLFSINNASAAPAIAHVTLWTDKSIPTLDFNVYLTGYDVQTFNLRDLFLNGEIPQTSHNNTSISPVGLFSSASSPNPNFAPSPSCDSQLPLPPLPATLLNHIQLSHTGQASPIFGGLCSGNPSDNYIGYITIDNVNFCTLDFPNALDYFIDGGNGAANNINQLWGDYFYVDLANNFAQGETLVHIEASDQLGAGDYTFYARYSGGADNREGLASAFAVRYGDFSPLPGGTSLFVWRDSKLDEGPFVCGGAPSWYPLSQNQIVIFDEQENPDVPVTTPFSPAIPGTSLIPFPAETNNTQVGGPAFPVPFQFGWLYLNLNTITGGLPAFDPITQNWVTAKVDAFGLFSVGFDAIQLDNVTVAPSDIILPVN
jgi:hypothetical protein